MIGKEVFQYKNPNEILARAFEEKKAKNPLFSIRSWSKHLGFKTPSYLADVLSGKRKLKPNLALRLSESLGLERDGKEYFETLVFLENAQSDSEREFYQRAIDRITPQGETRQIEFPVIDWRDLHIEELPCLKDFKEDYEYLAKRTGLGHTAQALQLGIDRALKAGTLVRDKNGKIMRPQRVYRTELNQDKSTPIDSRIAQIRRKMMEHAIRRLDIRHQTEAW